MLCVTAAGCSRSAFGAVAVIVEYADVAELAAAVDRIQGSLAGSVFTADEDDTDAAACLALLSPKVGRLCANDWPTGVAYSWAQQHGGPWPSTSAPSATSVGAAALDRFVRPVTYQSLRDEWLPPALQAANPWAFPSGRRRASTAWGDAMSLPLEGLLVADFSQVLAGPLAAAMLADLGALVIKVERPRVGDDTRRWGPPWTENSSSYFEAANRSKKSIELDLSDPKDQQLARELARRADVLLENYRDGQPGAQGPGLRPGRSPRTLASCTPPSPGSAVEGKRPARVRLPRQAVGGLMSITGTPGEPMKAGVALVDVLTAKDAVIGILAALRAREPDGTGQRVEVNLLSSLLGSLANQASRLPGDRKHTGEHGQPAPVHRSLRNSGRQGRTSRHLLWQ